MAKKKETIPYVCLDCGNHWKKSKYGAKRCPKCGSQNVTPEEEAAETLGSTSPLVEGEPVYEEEPVPPEAEKPKGPPKKAPPKRQTSPFVLPISKDSKSVDLEDRSPQEKAFAGLLMDVGLKQYDLIARIIMRSDKAEDPRYIDSMLKKYNVDLIRRQMIIDYWCSTQGIESPLLSSTTYEGGAQQETEFGRMAREMMDMVKFKMMSKMLIDDDDRRRGPPPEPRRDPEPMVPMRDAEGNVMIDETTGQIVKVPASIFMAYQAQQSRQQPTQLDQFMEMMNYNMESQKMFFEMMGGSNKGPDPEMMAKVSSLEAMTKVQEVDTKRQAEIDELKAEIMVERARQDVERQMGQYIGERDKQIKALKEELQSLRRSREVSYQEAQVEMARKSSEMAIDTVQEAAKEFRETRKEIRGLVTEGMKNQQYVDATRGRLQAGPVQEIPLEEVGRDLDSLEAQFGMLGQRSPIDYGMTAPEGRSMYIGDVDEEDEIY